MVRSADLGPGAMGVNSTWNGKQKSWLIVTGNWPDGGTIANSEFDDVMESITKSPPLVLQTLRVPDSFPWTHEAAKTGGPGTWISGIRTLWNVSRHTPRPRVPRYRLISPPGAS